MSLLDDIIDGATAEGASTANLLRKVVVVCHRIGADEVRLWANNELNGFGDEVSTLPPYRGPLSASVRAHYAGPAGSSATQTLSPHNVPEWFATHFFKVSLRQPLAELEEAAAAAEDPIIAWPATAVVQWNRWEEDGTVPRIEWMNVLFASTVVSRMMVRGVIDRIRNNALGLALDLQRDFPDAGELGGPTVTDSGVQQVIHSITNNIYGDGTNVSLGPGSSQSSVIAKGDLVGFLQALRDLGIEGAPLNELASIMAADDEPETKRTKALVIADRIRSGSVVLGTELAATLAADGVVALVAQFLG